MDYWPNVDAVRWFVAEMLPALRKRWPRLRLTIVGRSPTPAVQALAGEAVRVTGTVPDVRPWLQYAAVVVAPLRLARGVQNKVLEAMAMARPVVAAASCVEAIDAQPGRHLAAASEVADYVAAVSAWLASPTEAQRVGSQARDCVVERYGWAARLAPVDRCLEAA
jgi:glycosyltransferase involved in cell wall biosynthesis